MCNINEKLAYCTHTDSIHVRLASLEEQSMQIITSKSYDGVLSGVTQQDVEKRAHPLYSLSGAYAKGKCLFHVPLRRGSRYGIERDKSSRGKDN